MQWGNNKGGGEMKRLPVSVVLCLVALATTAPAFAQGNNPCAGDIARFCGNIEPGMGRIADCLRQNEAQLSPGCREQHLAEVAQAIRQTQQACNDDSVRFCGSYLQQPGEGLLNCLKLNAPSLSPECKKKLFDTLNLMPY
jgi:hypothetical protein